MILLNPGNRYPLVVSKEIWAIVCVLEELRVIEFETFFFITNGNRYLTRERLILWYFYKIGVHNKCKISMTETNINCKLIVILILRCQIDL